MDILKSLTRISTDYSCFERDQVLTAGQLNSITDYLDDQNRLTRVNLLGVGIACGLRVSLQGNAVKVSKGVGITTDGDILYFNEDTLFDKFKLYDKRRPAYAPFYVDGDVTRGMITVYELVRSDLSDKDAASLDQFNTQTRKLENMVAVLFMESYTTDTDICSGTDCDNLGEDCKNTVKLLLVDNKSIGLLKHSIPEPNQNFNGLKKVVISRPLFDANIISYSDIVERYRVVCHQIHNDILSQLKILDGTYSGFLVNIFAKNPVPEWVNQLNGINELFPKENPGIQYYYDFLKDVAETYNQFHEQLFFGSTCCCPGVDEFPKHLLLGNLAPTPGDDPDKNRTEFYPSPIVSRTAEQLNYVKFLARKIDMLIQAFQVWVSEKTKVKDIRITPSMFEDQPLEERAIPYYYQINEKYPIHTFWNYRLHQRGMDEHNYSYYNADLYSNHVDLKILAEPLQLQIGRFSFFRIEGHLGQNVSKVIKDIERMVKSNNLPFAVCSVMTGKDPGKGTLLFFDFISQHPGIEHFAGVVRGGTFVVVYDKNENVVADFMLPYYWYETKPEQPSTEIRDLIPYYGERGASIIIQGVNFDTESRKNIVAFNGTPAMVLDAAATKLTVSVPEQATTGFVTVLNKFGFASSPIPFIIPRHFQVSDYGINAVDLSYDAKKGEVWVSGVSQFGEGVLLIVGLEQKKVLSTINLDGVPGEFALSPKVRVALVTRPSANEIRFIDMESPEVVIKAITVTNPRGLAISPDGRWGYVIGSDETGESKDLVCVIDLIKREKMRDIHGLGLMPTRVQVIVGRMGRSSLEIFVNNTGDGTISVIDVKTTYRVKTTKVGGVATSSPQEVAVSRETYPVWTANSGNGTASMIAEDHSVIDIPIGITPGSVAVLSKGNRAFFVGPSDKELIMVDMDDDKAITKRVVGMSGFGGATVKGVATTPDDSGVIVIHPNPASASGYEPGEVSIFDARAMRLQALVKVPSYPFRCMVTDDNKYVLSLCAPFRGWALSVIERESVLPY